MCGEKQGVVLDWKDIGYNYVNTGQARDRVWGETGGSVRLERYRL